MKDELSVVREVAHREVSSNLPLLLKSSEQISVLIIRECDPRSRLTEVPLEEHAAFVNFFWQPIRRLYELELRVLFLLANAVTFSHGSHHSI